MAATYDSTLPTTKDQLRFLIYDNKLDPSANGNGEVLNPLFQDTEIAWLLNNNKNVFYAAAAAAEQLASRYAGKADKYVGPLRVMYRDFQDRYNQLADRLRRQSGMHSGFKAILTAKHRPGPFFAVGMHDIGLGDGLLNSINIADSSGFSIDAEDAADLQSPFVVGINE